MASVVGRINNLQTSLTPSERKVADFLVRHPDRVIKNSIGQVAAAAKVSVASVSRLASTLGYDDWKEMRLNLVRDASANANPVFPEIGPEDSDAAAAGKVFDRNIRSLHDTYTQLDMAALGRVVAAVGKTDRVVFFGSGGSGYLAQDEALRFSHLELKAEAYTTEYLMLLQSSRMKKGEIAFGFSNSGRTRAAVAALAEAKRNHAFTVGICNHQGVPLEDVSDVFFSTSFPSRGGLTASLTARIALLCIMDAIYVLAAKHGRIAARVRHIDNVLEENLRLPVKARRRSSGSH